MNDEGRRRDARKWQDVEFNDADDVSPHLSMDDGTIVVNHASLLAAMTRTNIEDWRRIATPTVPKNDREFLWFGCRQARLTARVEDERGFCWSANVFDSDDAVELATLCVPLDASLLATA